MTSKPLTDAEKGLVCPNCSRKRTEAAKTTTPTQHVTACACGYVFEASALAEE
jgi:hypothetical protein